MKDTIRIRGARQHNLKGFDLDIPRRAITVVTGVSGSGKSSLAFDTLYAEGQRRYVESLSAYARQFLERMEKPAVDSIEGISPAVAIEQKNPTRTSRSTVGTATEIYDYLRLLWARVGRTYCPKCGRELRPDTVQSVTDAVLALPEGTRFLVACPLVRSSKVSHAVIAENLRARGFVRVAVPATHGVEVLHLDDVTEETLNLATRENVSIVVDRLRVEPSARGRIADAVQTAFTEGDGDARILLTEAIVPPESIAERVGAAPGNAVWQLAFTERFECPNDGTRAPSPTPQLFSFNNPRGACPTCNGFGATLDYDLALIVPHPERSLRDGAIDPWTAPRYEKQRRLVVDFARTLGVSADVPWSTLPAEAQQKLLRTTSRAYTGILPFLEALEEKKYKQYIRIFLRQYQSARPCRDCGGTKLQPEALQVRVDGRTIAEVAQWPVRDLRTWIDALTLSGSDAVIADAVLREARARTRFLTDVGLTYLTLDRATRTLSGGEAQRITLSNALGAALVDATYVLDEPSIGLHSRDLDRLLSLLTRLRDLGNTVVMVEHDLEAMRIADYMVEMGPAAGEHGGQVVFAGPMADVEQSPLTGQYLTGARRIEVPTKRRPVGPRWLELKGARAHNVHGVDLRIPLGAMTVVTGVSGSGKSTMVHDVLFHALESRLHGEHSAKEHLGETVGGYTSLTGFEHLDDVVLVDQSPIGKSPRSNPVTYVKAFDEVRRLFAESPLSKTKGFAAGHFSFNVAGGRCDHCEGAGAIEVEMVFMADVFVPCDACGGKRFKPEVLEVRVRGKNIADVLELTVDEAIRFFPREDKLAQALWHVQQVGLGYLRLGQPATTLSGGEAQRLKIARELALTARGAARKLYVMDEPTTGLHLEDIRRLAQVFERLLSQGHTLLLIEHHLDVIKLADWIVDMGPDGGDGGGQVVAMGRPEEIVQVAASHTGRWLRTVLPGSGTSVK
ncbi:MAG TPA: excinuclease ABC subunit UvrA [Gemmatimonas aurantiaca]|uniref:UvrABC system protein A n=2 Tax=Gemmatimonas aurantiaca TaxID=173480 RepID=C1A9P0_GEMAT|nr:excinuclease ABC subunit UvrA [Gemmatimonas aurantiaca]BAH39217.1 UvrABC system protein A [Gemmatimonas aurantiaca T-27]HCT57516.1 excinuclease ABC subunit UvrA [Gemmatimonas aurantiaca]